MEKRSFKLHYVKITPIFISFLSNELTDHCYLSILKSKFVTTNDFSNFNYYTRSHSKC